MLNAALLAVLPGWFGLTGIALAALAGVILTSLLLLQRQNLLRSLNWPAQWSVCVTLLAIAALALHPIHQLWLQLILGTLGGTLCLLSLAVWLKPWRS